jgi:protein gp37
MRDLLNEAIEAYNLNGVHRAAEVMPFMGEDEFSSFVEDVDENGFQNAIKVTKDRLLIDGRNRICASIVLEKDVRIEEFTPSDPLQYVRSENEKRRHLTKEQLAVVAIKAAEYAKYSEEAKQRQREAGENFGRGQEKVVQKNCTSNESEKGKTRDKLAKDFDTNREYVSAAIAVQKHAPELLDDVHMGAKPLKEAAKEARQRKKEAQGQFQEIGGSVANAEIDAAANQVATEAMTGTIPPSTIKLDPGKITTEKVDGKVAITPSPASEPMVVPSGELPLPPKPEPNPIETINQNGYTIHVWHNKPKNSPSFNTSNESIDWAWSTWNPVTGCLHGCNYCYAERIATNERMAAVYPKGFEPVFHPYRLDAPKHARQFTEQEIIKKAQERRLDLDQAKLWAKNVFVCSMADLFGKWVPDDWIMQVFDSVIKYPQWNYLFLTKYPQRLQAIGEQLGGSFPDNCWVGTTVDEQKRVKIAQDAFAKIKAPVKWLSLEPLLTNLEFTDLEMFDMVAIGGETDGNPYCNSCGQVDPKRVKFTPPWEWVESILLQARKSGTAVYFKENLKCRPKELPF